MSFHLISFSNSIMQQQIKNDILKCNDYIGDYNLTLTSENCNLLMERQANALKNYGRIEFGGATILRLIETFYDSSYFNNNNFADSIGQLIDVFYYFKNETEEKISDEELAHWLKTYFNQECKGSIELLMSRDMEKLVSAVKNKTAIEDIEKEETSILFNVDESEEEEIAQ